MTDQQPSGYFWPCPRCQTANPAGSSQCRSCGAANPYGSQPAQSGQYAVPPQAPPSTASVATSPPKKRRRFGWGCLLPVGVIVILVVGVVYFLSQETQEILRTIDDALITDAQQEMIDEVSVSSSCLELRATLAWAQEELLGSDPDDRFMRVYPERLKEAAEEQLDTLRCGG